MGGVYSPNSFTCLSKAGITNASPLWRAGNGIWEQLLAQRKGVPLIHNATLNDDMDVVHAPPPARRKAAILPLKRSALLSHCSLNAGWPGRPRPFNSINRHYRKVESWLEPGKLNTWHPRCSISNCLLKENRHFLDYSFCRERGNLLHVLHLSRTWILKAFGITSDFGSKKWQSPTLWCSGLIYLFCTGIHNLCSTSLLWLTWHCWHNQILQSH